LHRAVEHRDFRVGARQQRAADVDEDVCVARIGQLGFHPHKRGVHALSTQRTKACADLIAGDRRATLDA
jgi:hypothetical protein